MRAAMSAQSGLLYPITQGAKTWLPSMVSVQLGRQIYPEQTHESIGDLLSTKCADHSRSFGPQQKISPKVPTVLEVMSAFENCIVSPS